LIAVLRTAIDYQLVRGGGQVMYRLALTAVVQVAKAILSFLGLIVQSAIIDESELRKLA
jgi:hypothetical protein